VIQLRRHDIDQWSEETKFAYVACAIDTDGWIGLGNIIRKDNGTKRITCTVGVTNQNVELLKRIATICEVPFNLGLNNRVGIDKRGINTTKECYQVIWRSPKHVIPILEKCMPYLVAKNEQANNVLEFAKRRLQSKQKGLRGSKPYIERDFELVQECRVLNNTNRKFRGNTAA